jgi:hypothetical protein
MTAVEIMLAVFIAIEGIALLNNLITSAFNRRQGQEVVNNQKSMLLSQMGTKEVHEKNAKVIDELIYRIESIEKVYQPALEAVFTRIEDLEREVAKLKSKAAP